MVELTDRDKEKIAEDVPRIVGTLEATGGKRITHHHGTEGGKIVRITVEVIEKEDLRI